MSRDLSGEVLGPVQTEFDEATSLADTSGAGTPPGATSGGGEPAGEETEGSVEAPAPRPAWRDPLVLVVAALVLLPAVAAIVSALRNPYAPSDDWALMELQVRDVGTGDTPLVGSWSRFGWEHPGPWALWLLAGFYRLVPAEHGLLFAAGMCNLVALAGCVALALRRPRAQALVVLVGLALLVRGLGAAGLGDPWNPILPIVPFALFCLACVELAIAPRRWLLAVAVGAGSLVIQAHIGFIQPVVLVAATTAGLVWWRARSDRAAPEVAGGTEPAANGETAGADPDESAATTSGTAESIETGGATERADATTRRGARLRYLWPAALVFAVAWFPVVLDQVAGQGNIGRIVRWAAGDDLGVPPNVMNDGRLGPERVARSAAWLLEPFGLWIGEYVQPNGFGVDLLGSAPAIRLLWIPCALGAALLLTRWTPARDRWPTVCCAAVGSAGIVAVGTDLFTAEGLPVSWPFRWAAVPVMLVWITVGWAVVGFLSGRVGRAVGAAAVPQDRGRRVRSRVGRLVSPGVAAGLAGVIVLVVGLTVWRGSVGVQPAQPASEALLRIAPQIEDELRDEGAVAANSKIKLNKIDLGLPVLLERAGIEWVEPDDPRSASLPGYSVHQARALEGPLGLQVGLGQAEVVARTDPSDDGRVPGLILVRLPPVEERVPADPEVMAALLEAARTP